MVKKSSSKKPKKPRPDFPLTPHAKGKWCKLIKGRMYYFGRWSDPEGALREYVEVRDELFLGIDPRQGETEPDIDWLVNSFCEAKLVAAEDGDLAMRTYKDYLIVGKRIVAHFGRPRLLTSLRPADFARYRRTFDSDWSPVTVNNELRRSRAFFNWANKNFATEHPIRFGDAFDLVSAKKLRVHKSKQNPKYFEASEIWSLLGHADFQLRAMILLGINAAYGGADCSRLLITDIDFDKSWLSAHRGKTGVGRDCHLWPETIEALRTAIDNRYQNAPQSLADRVFLTKRRQVWFNEQGGRDALPSRFKKLAVAAGVYRTGVGHYSLRHCFETEAGNRCQDQPAIDRVMGHDSGSMAANYRQRIDHARITAVCNSVRDWLMESKPKA